MLRHERGGCAGLLRCGKGTTWEGGVRVPALAYWPGTIMPRESMELMATWDIVPTVMSLVDGQAPDISHGYDMKDFLLNGDEVHNI